MTFTPSRACSSLSRLRQASSSVMSASSLWVTCGIATQLRARFGPEIRWIRERWTRSTGPNFSKFSDGQGARSNPNPGPAAEGVAGPLEANDSTSPRVIRPLRPLPWTWCRSIPRSRARRLTDGLA